MSAAITPPNRLLKALAPDDQERLAPHLVRVGLDARFSMERADEPIGYAYFMERGIASVVACTSEKDRCIEGGLVGLEGVTASALILGDDRSPNETYVQVAGAAQRIAAEDLCAAMEESAPLKALLLRYVQTFFIQVSHTALANGTAKIEERLARWLLMAQDRMGQDELPLTHEFMSTMLGVRRPGVTDTLHQIEAKGVIRATRGMIRIIDREGLKLTAGSLYGLPEAEYARLLG